MKNNKGFSLVELIVVIAIMAILAAVAIPTFATFIEKANVASDKQFVDDLKYSITLANTTSGEEATLTKVTVTNDKISAVEYTVGDEKVILEIANGKAALDADATDLTQDADLKKAAEDVIASMDWTYNFKSKEYKAGYTAPTQGAEG